jgi:hypothetical protein
MKLKQIFNEPKIIAVVGNPNSAKSNLLYHIIESLRQEGEFNLVTYGLRNHIKGSLEIFSVEELEQIENSIIILDEVMTLWDLNDRKVKRQIENTLRLIFHNNNILVLCAIPENIKKFIASKLNQIFFKKCNLSEFINGSRVKRIVLSYKGYELGSSVLELEKGDTIFYDGLHYQKIKVPYYEKYDTKKTNCPIIRPQKCSKSVKFKKSEKEVKKDDRI